ncbi:H-NS family nucleoid-associated regulatory protein [Burkholderia sp. BE17]|uniref:H-NS histone family protein n=1 Tax=Burkholderia sp. BE17 TaxID=2656644 RepID=UPI00128C3CFE|nr:H-NS histone family protein [Burkholderia sp. BE17]MPV64322.1 H-NS histone family protein [Burkholderia sp. BE17]
MKTYKELLEQRDSLDGLISEAKSKVRTTVVIEVQRLVEEFDIASREIFGAMPSQRPRPQKRAKPSAKYRNPATGETWSGRGRPPAWIVGRDRLQFEIVGTNKQHPRCHPPASTTSTSGEHQSLNARHSLDLPIPRDLEHLDAARMQQSRLRRIP